MENKHSAFDLSQMQSLPLDMKIKMTERRVIEWYEHWNGNVYLSVSGGKDSQVLAHIIDGLTNRNLIGKVPKYFVNTGLEFDSVRKKGTELADEVLRPEMSFADVIIKYGYPVLSKRICHDARQVKKNPTTSAYIKFFDGSNKGKSMYDHTKYAFLLKSPFRVSELCCDEMKKKPLKKIHKTSGAKSIVATMATESVQRRNKWLKYGCNSFEQKEAQSNPMSFWTEQDVLMYIKKNKLDIADVYGNVGYIDDDGMMYDDPLFNNDMKLVTSGESRTGCIFCMFGITFDTERFLRLKAIEPAKYDYIMRGGKFDEEGMWIPAPDENGKMGLGYKFVIDWLNENGGLDIKY